MSLVFASVKAHGAVGDGSADDTAAIQASINLGNIIVPPGTYLFSDQVTVPSHRTIKLLPGAVMKRKSGTGKQNSTVSDNANFWVNADQVNGNTDITIEGGVYDGNQANQPPINYGNTSRYCGGTGMRFDRVTDLVLKDITFQNNISFQIQVGHVNRFDISRIRFLFSGSAVHQDGVHVNGPSSNGIIRDIFSNGGNDGLIALNADDAIFGKMTDGGDITNILIENVSCPFQTFTPYQGSLIMLLNGPSNIKDITARNFRGIGAQASAVINLNSYPDVGSNTGIMDRVVFENFDVETPCVNDCFCQLALNVGSISFINCRWKPGVLSADLAATYQCFIQQYDGHVENLTMANIQIVEHNNPDNTPFALHSVTNLMISNVLLTRPSEASQAGFLIDLNGSSNVTNCCVNGVVASQISQLINGTAAGALITSAVCTNPPL